MDIRDEFIKEVDGFYLDLEKKYKAFIKPKDSIPNFVHNRLLKEKLLYELNVEVDSTVESFVKEGKLNKVQAQKIYQELLPELLRKMRILFY